MPRTTSERTLAARERIAAVKEDRARLPRAICGACGGVVAEGEGLVSDPDPWETFDPWVFQDRERIKSGLPRVMRWRRTHARCSTPQQIVQQILGGELLSLEVAAAALDAARVAVGWSLVVRASHESIQSRAISGRQPWAHLTDAARDALREAVKRERAAVEPRRCRDGACAWCGRSHSVGWRGGPETWPDGSPAPLCADCARVWDTRGNPEDRDDLRACALESLSGANGWGSDGMGIRTFADVAGDDHAGHPQPWAYAPDALAALREEARRSWPSSLSEPLRSEYVARRSEATRRALEETRAAQAAEAAAEAERKAEAARAAGWPI